jgi:hypothetical protein
MTAFVVGDIHGEDWWKTEIFGAKDLFESLRTGDESMYKNFKFLIQDWNKIIFVGDYVDSFHVSTPDMIDNLKDIILFARAFPEKVVLLLGNHDIQYIHTQYRCSGFRAEAYFDFTELFRDNADLFKAAYLHGPYLITHAGVTDRFWNICEHQLNKSRDLYNYLDPNNNIADHLNFLYSSNFQPLFYVGQARGGSSFYPGIFWADKRELTKDPLEGYSQIVGHTHIKKKEIIALPDGNSIVFIDAEEKPYDLIDTDPNTKTAFPTVRGMNY